MLTGTITYDQEFLNQFEEGIDPFDPEHGRIPARVLGYGEMSTVMTISGADPGLVFKRMPMFRSQSELEPYLALYDAYLQHLTAAGVAVVPAAITSVTPSKGNVVVYIIQEKLDGSTLVNQAIHALPDDDVQRLFTAILTAIGQVFAYNDANESEATIGFDAQMSNWAIEGYDAANGRLRDPVQLVYIDTSSPLLRLNGQEQLDPELFLRSAPSFLRWVIRLLFMEDVLNRYYDRRQVIIDVLANLYKEKRVDVIPTLLAVANTFLEKNARGAELGPIIADEIASYYKEDARIWTVYLTFRRLDRWIHRLLGLPYPYVLPGPVYR
jgi:hypothetical protein